MRAGYWTDHISRRGFRARGLDLVPAFVDHARATYRGNEFVVGSIDRIPAEDGSFGGILAWYSTIYPPPERIGDPMAEFARVLPPGGWMVLGFFDGDLVERFDHAVSPAFRWPPSELAALLEAAGFGFMNCIAGTGS